MRGMSFTPAATRPPGSGATIQRQPAAPTKTAEKSEEKPGATEAEAKASHEGEGGELSPIRKKLFDLFGRFEKHVIGDDVFDALSLESTIASKSQIGGTSREQVARALADARSYLKE